MSALQRPWTGRCEVDDRPGSGRFFLGSRCYPGGSIARAGLPWYRAVS